MNRLFNPGSFKERNSEHEQVILGVYSSGSAPGSLLQTSSTLRYDQLCVFIYILLNFKMCLYVMNCSFTGGWSKEHCKYIFYSHFKSENTLKCYYHCYKKDNL